MIAPLTLEQVSFVRPELLGLLALLPLLAALYVATFVARRRALTAFAGSGARLVSTSALRQVAKALLLLLACSALVIALAGPYLDVREREVRLRGVDLVIALDVSQSMAVRDVAPDRLRAARQAIQELAQQLQGSRVALVLFAAEGVVRYPATTDPDVLAQALDSSGRAFRPAAGSSLRAGVESALGAFPPTARESQRAKAVLVISDGEDLTADPPDLERVRERNVRVFTLSVGTAAGGQIPTYDFAGRFIGMLRGADGQPVVSRMHDDTLRALADRGGGRHWHYEGDASLRELVSELRSMGTSELSGEAGTTPNDRYQLFLAAAVAALLLEWLVSDRRTMPRPVYRSAARVRRPGRLLGAGAR